FVFLQIEDSGNVGMIKRSENFGFAPETAHTCRVARKFIRQNLDGNFSLEFDVARAIDLAHSALAEQGCDFIRAELLANLERHRLCAILWNRSKTRNELQRAE